MAKFKTYKQFKAVMSSLSNQDRMIIVEELLPLTVANLSNPRLNRTLYRQIHSAIKGYVRSKKRSICNSNFFKIWLCAMTHIDDLNQWRFEGTNLYKPTAKNHGNEKPEWRRKPRRETIRDCNGDAIPRRWLDRFAPSIKTQEDWDQAKKNIF